MIAVAVAGLAASATAQAVISGTVVNTAGVPLDSVSVNLRTATDTYAGFDSTDENGAFSIATPSTPGPYTIKLSETDSCRAYNDPAYTQTLAMPGIADGAVGLVLTLDLRDFCAGSAPYSNPPPPEPTGIVDGVARRTVVPPGGLVYIKVRIPYGAVDPRVVLQNGTRISQPVTSSSSSLPVTAPAAGYNGPLSLVFGTSGGATITRNLGTLISQLFAAVRPSPGVPYDVEAIVDISGSMAGTDPKFLRKDALNLLADLSGTADGLGAVGFDSAFQQIFDLTRTTSQAVINLFKARVRTQVVNRGGTDYNIGMDKAWEALNAPGVDPNKPKLVIFLTDGAHNAGDYHNGHLRFAFPGLFNGMSQRPWPVCVVQLGRPSSFNATDVARLKRIAADTGGQYFATQSSSALTNIYFRCRGQSTGQKAILTKAFVFSKAGQQKQFRRRLLRGLRQVTFFVNTGGTFVPNVSLLTPAGKVIMPGTRKQGIVFRRGGTFAFFRITKPAGGNWQVIIRVVRLTDPSGRGQVSITVPAK